jgi:hypothetical protein
MCLNERRRMDQLDIVCISKGEDVDYVALQGAIDAVLANERLMKEIGTTKNIKKIVYVNRKLINFIT